MSDTLQSVVNITLQTLQAIPDPISSAVIGIVTNIWEIVQQTSQNKHQIRLLFQRICEILCSLKVPQNYGDESLQKAVDVLVRNLDNVLKFVVSEQKKSFLKAMLTADDLKLKLEEYERHIWTACLGFQNAALLSANRKLDDLWQLINSHQNQQSAIAAQQLALAQDTSDKLNTLRTAVTSTAFLDELLSTMQADPLHMVTAMEAVLEREESGQAQLRPEEIDFLRTSVKRLSSQLQGQKPKIKSWTVTGFEVERGFLLGSDVSSTMRVGRWLGKIVGIMELKDSETVQQIVKLWKGLRSMRIQGMLGASTMDMPPFLLLPYSPDNILDYLNVTRAPDYLRLLSDIARGLDYLHSRDPPVAHGGLRPATVHVDSYGNVALSCVGIREPHLAPVDTRLATTTHNALSLWRAPELTVSNDPTPASDIYSYGLLLSAMLDVLVSKHSSPPFDNEAMVQQLKRRCLESDPAARPNAGEILRIISGTQPELKEGDMFAGRGSLNVEDLPEGTAERWRLIPTSKQAYGIVIQGMDVVYLNTPPIDGADAHPLRRLSFELRCHDQGAEYTTALPKDGAWAWVEIAISRNVTSDAGVKQLEVNFEEECPGAYRGHMIEPTRWEILRCPFADDTPRTHRISFDQLHPLVRVAKKGDRILMYPKAMFPGWGCYIYSAEIHVVTEW